MAKRPEGSVGDGKSTYEITVMLVHAIAWPLIVLFLLFVYREPIRSIATQLPSLVASSSTISVAGVSVQVDRRLRSQASTEALAGMAALSADGMRTLMDLSRGQPIFTADDIQDGRVDREYGELLKSGLAELQTTDEGRFGKGARMIHVTERGRQTQELAYLLIADFAGQIAAAAKAAAGTEKK